MASKKNNSTVVSAYEQLYALGHGNLHRAFKYLNGKTVRIIGTAGSGGQNYGSIGTTFTVKCVPGSAIHTYMTSSGYDNSSYPLSAYPSHAQMNGLSGNTISLRDITICGDTVEDLKQMIEYEETNIKASNDRIEEYRLKISFMNANGLEKFDETDFKVFKTLELLDDPKLSKVNKARAIAELIKNS